MTSEVMVEIESLAEDKERSTTAPWPPERQKAVRICWPRPWDALGSECQKHHTWDDDQEVSHTLLRHRFCYRERSTVEY